MIKKSFRAYITAGQLVFGILAHGEVLGAPPGEAVEHVIHGVLEGFVVLPHLHAVYHLHQRVHVPFFLRPLEYDIGHQRAVKEGFRLRPEGVPLLALPFGVGNQGVDEF